MVATVGELNVHPNSRNVVPGAAHFTVDIRAWDDGLALRAWEPAGGRAPDRSRRATAAASAWRRRGACSTTSSRPSSSPACATSRRAARLLHAGHGERRRPRRELHGHRGADGDGVRAERGRAQPRRGRRRRAGRTARPAPTSCSSASSSPPRRDDRPRGDESNLEVKGETQARRGTAAEPEPCGSDGPRSPTPRPGTLEV